MAAIVLKRDCNERGGSIKEEFGEIFFSVICAKKQILSYKYHKGFVFLNLHCESRNIGIFHIKINKNI